MKIVDRKAFLALPAGTVFAKYQPHVFGAWEIKEGTMGEDYVVQDLFPFFAVEGDSWEEQWKVLESIKKGAPSPPMDFDCAGRDGLFDRDQLFGVLERADLEALIARLQLALAEGYLG